LQGWSTEIRLHDQPSLFQFSLSSSFSLLKERD
jgi:hypothetical protein